MKLGDIINTKGGWRGRVAEISDGCGGVKYSNPIAKVEQIKGAGYILVIEKNLEFNSVSKEYDQVSW